MIMTNKLLPVALVAALIGGSVGAVVMHSRSQPTEPQTASSAVPATDVRYQADASGRDQVIPAEFNSSAEQSAYKSGFADGFRSCESGAVGVNTSSLQPGVASGVAYRNTGRSYTRSSSSSRRVYYDY